MRAVFLALASLLVAACGDQTESPPDVSDAAEQVASARMDGPRAIEGLPDPCDWLNASEAQEILGLLEAPPRTSMGGPNAAGRSCVHTNEAQTAWINVGYQGLTPQVLTAQGKTEGELIELARTVYTQTLNHVYSGQTDGYPTLAFEDAERTIMVVFTNIGKARDLPEGISDRLSMSTYYNVLLHLFVPDQSSETRLESLKGLADRPVAQLKKAAAGD